MSTTTDAPGETLFTQLAIAVYGEEAAGPSEPIHEPARAGILPIRFEARRGPAAPAVLTFFPETAEAAARDAAPHARIPADRVASVTRTQHGRNWHGPESAPGIDLVRQRLRQPRINLVRLQFRLRRHAQLVHPTSSLSLPPSAAYLGGLASLARASVFSVYMPHDAFPRATYQGLYHALRPFLDPKPTPQAGLVSEPPPLYSTTGEASAPRQARSLRPESVDAEDKPSPVPGSEHDTVAVTTPSGFDSTDGDHSLEHDHDHPQSRDATTAPEADAGKRSLGGSSSDEAVDSRHRRQTKRPRRSPKSDVFFESEPSSPCPDADPPSTRPRAEPTAPFADLYQRIARLEGAHHALAQQNKLLVERVARLECANRTSTEQNKMLVQRVEELECLSLEVEELDGRIDGANENHDALETRVESVEVQYHELEEDCGRLEREFAADRDESKEEMWDYLGGLLDEYVDKAVRDVKDEFKTKLRRLLDD